MQVRQEPSSAGAAWLLKYSTPPDLIATRQLPQLPARQPHSTLTPSCSAKSKSEVKEVFHIALLPDLPNVTLTIGALSNRSVWLLGTRLTVAGPKASKNTCVS